MFTLTIGDENRGNVYANCEIIAIILEPEFGMGKYGDYELAIHISYGNGIRVVKLTDTYNRKDLVAKWTAGLNLKILELNKEKELTKDKIFEEIEKMILIKNIGKKI